jgi:hypothetical protein
VKPQRNSFKSPKLYTKASTKATDILEPNEPDLSKDIFLNEPNQSPTT